MKIGYFSPSYKRPEKSKTQLIYPFIKLVVRESEAENYIKNGNDIIICPDSAQGNIARVRNWILDSLLPNFDAVVIIDDDCSGVGYWEKQKYYFFDSEYLQEFIESMYVLTCDYGFKLFGFNCIMDKGAYKEHTPFATNQFIGAPCSMILNGNECRYDEQIPLKEDYDFTLQNLKKYKGALRANFASYNVKQAKNVGGCADMRNVQEEARQFELLQKKWGNKIIKKDVKSKRSFDFNPLMKSPLKGV
jgi:hypothetical protein